MFFFKAIYSNIRSALKMFFDKFELSLQRLSLKLEQALCILKIFENFMFIYSINLSGIIINDEYLILVYFLKKII